MTIEARYIDGLSVLPALRSCERESPRSEAASAERL